MGLADSLIHIKFGIEIYVKICLATLIWMMNSEIFRTVILWIWIFWIVTLCILADGYNHSGAACCLTLQGH
jgi:hypothetical protein